jgi:ATP-dependent DNA helicase RecG
LRRLRVTRDDSIIEAARQAAGPLVEADPELTEHPALAEALAELLDAERQAYLERG